jgi:hypothetical protein
LYAGESAERSRELLIAANIAGAASLAASSDSAAMRQAIRDGVIDFSVTSLEEALRILKNEIRKRQPVSVGVAVDSRKLVEQMIDRGVLPDLLPPLDDVQARTFLKQGATEIGDPTGDLATLTGEFVTWSVDREFNRLLPTLDACVQAVVSSDDHPRQRWLRRSSRYLGRIAQRHHGVGLSPEETTQFQVRAREMLRQHPDANAKIEIKGEILA